MPTPSRLPPPSKPRLPPPTTDAQASDVPQFVPRLKLGGSAWDIKNANAPEQARTREAAIVDDENVAKLSNYSRSEAAAQDVVRDMAAAPAGDEPVGHVGETLDERASGQSESLPESQEGQQSSDNGVVAMLEASLSIGLIVAWVLM